MQEIFHNPNVNSTLRASPWTTCASVAVKFSHTVTQSLSLLSALLLIVIYMGKYHTGCKLLNDFLTV